MNNILDFQKCSNCGACYNACPKDAITLNEDGLFYELHVSADKCIECGICKKVCPVNVPEERQQVLCAYGLIHNDEDVVKHSSSGGAFSAIAEYVIENGGIVFGAAFSNDYRSVELVSTETRSLDDLRRSKYVESKVGFTFRDTKAQLDIGRLVLYCGAPCQIAGLKRYLGRNYNNLITCDFSCGGFPSHNIYSEYLTSIEKKLSGEICEVNFRPKVYGWTNHAIKICTTNGRRYIKHYASDPFFTCFIGSSRYSSVREYCMTCNFANNHYSDIILADLWSFETISKIRNKNKGISLIITNSEKGESVIRSISKKVALTVLNIDEATYNLKEKKIPDEFINKRSDFLTLIEEKGVLFAMDGVKLQNPLKFKVKYAIKKLIGRE